LVLGVVVENQHRLLEIDQVVLVLMDLLPYLHQVLFL
jgi:hypothetical protein